MNPEEQLPYFLSSIPLHSENHMVTHPVCLSCGAGVGLEPHPTGEPESDTGCDLKGEDWSRVDLTAMIPYVLCNEDIVSHLAPIRDYGYFKVPLSVQVSVIVHVPLYYVEQAGQNK